MLNKLLWKYYHPVIINPVSMARALLRGDYPPLGKGVFKRMRSIYIQNKGSKKKRMAAKTVWVFYNVLCEVTLETLKNHSHLKRAFIEAGLLGAEFPLFDNDITEEGMIDTIIFYLTVDCPITNRQRYIKDILLKEDVNTVIAKRRETLKTHITDTSIKYAIEMAEAKCEKRTIMGAYTNKPFTVYKVEPGFY